MAKPDEQPNLPPIPDGGLSESMPEWLRRPPAWRTLKDSEVVPTEPATTATLPEADTSVIDPTTFLTDDDLPVWLRGLGRGRQPVEPVGDDEPAVGVMGSEPQPVEKPAPADGAQPAAVRFAPIQPATSTGEPASGDDSQPRQQPAGRAPLSSEAVWWQGGRVVALLGLLLLVAIVVIVILSVV